MRGSYPPWQATSDQQGQGWVAHHGLPGKPLASSYGLLESTTGCLGVKGTVAFVLSYLTLHAKLRVVSDASGVRPAT